jgi:hypothetical protein
VTYYSGLDNLSKADAQTKIEWFRGRFRKVIVRPLMAVKRIGVRDQAIWDLNLGVVTIICSAIEALGSFYCPGAKDKTAFNEFVTAFMEPGTRTRPQAAGRTRRSSTVSSAADWHTGSRSKATRWRRGQASTSWTTTGT